MTALRPRRSAIIAFSPVKFDSRVRRIARLLRDAGDDVMLLSGDQVPPDALTGVRHVFLPGAGLGRAEVLRQIATAAPARVMPRCACSLQRALPPSRRALAALSAFRPDIIHANDWSTLPAAVAAAGESRARLVYDSHEIAVDEHAHLLWWRLTMPPHIAAIEDGLIGAADHVITVSEGVGGVLCERYGARIRRLGVIRNLPEERIAPAPRFPRDLTLVYTGLISADRRIDVMIEALALTARRWRLRVIGFGQASAIDPLRRQAAALGLADRLEWHPAVAPEAIVPALADADIGLFLSDGATRQQRAALPNKVFEYAAASLGLIASGSDDVARLVARHKHGRILVSASATELAATLDALDDATIEVWRQNAAAMAATENWTIESRKLLAIYAALSAARSDATM